MRCCVPFCKNTYDNVSTSARKGISFHGLPSDVRLRAAWLKALGKQDSHLPDSAVVCSQHFLNDDICETESGLRQIGAGAIPSTVQVCMICLDTDSKLYLMSKHKLEDAYEKLTGHSVCDPGNLKQTLCIQCAQRLKNFSQFRDKSLRARELMMDLVEKHELITRRHIKMINRTKNQLKSDFVVTTLAPDHCDLYILDPSEHKQTESEATVHRVVVKNEEGYDSPVDEDMEVTNEDDNNADNISGEFVASKVELLSDDSIMLDTKLMDDAIGKALERNPAVAEQVAETLEPLKCEFSLFQCTLCSEEFVIEHAYMQHMHMHGQNGEGDGGWGSSQVCKPHTAVSSSHSSRLTENEQASQLNDEPRPSPDSAQTPVAHLFTRLATSDEHHAQAAGDDAVPKSKQVFKITNDELENEFSNTNSITHINRLTDCVVKLYDIFKKPKKGEPIPDESLAKTGTAISYSQCHIDTATKDFNCEVLIRNEYTRHTLEDTGPDTNKEKVKNRNVSKPLQSEMYYSKNDKSENNLLIEKNSFICDACNITFQRRSLLIQHLGTHSEVKPFTCKFCQYKSKYECYLNRHMQTHTGAKLYTCELCEYRSKYKGNLLRHSRTHTGEKPYSCKLCKYKSSQNSKLVRHMRTHTGEKPYSCKLCEYKCSQNNSLIKHMRTHTGEKPYSCKLCEYKCSYNGRLIRHMRTHTGEKPYSCKLCKYKSSQNSKLVRHMRTHTGEKPYSCKLCEYKCSQNNSLIKHMRTHTGEKPYSCKLCEYKCSENSKLVQHIRTHTGEKPYSCKLCEYKCTQNSNLVKHIRTHTGEKPYSCKLCDYKFSENKSLIEHMRTHTGEKPYSCKLCEYKCTQNYHLVRHMRTHTGEKAIFL